MLSDMQPWPSSHIFLNINIKVNKIIMFNNNNNDSKRVVRLYNGVFFSKNTKTSKKITQVVLCKYLYLYT